jgi:hypothetical protein
MVDYVAAPRRPRSVEAGDDYWPETWETLTVIIDDNSATDTGLVDQHGVTIWRKPARHPVGF